MSVTCSLHCVMQLYLFYLLFPYHGCGGRRLFYVDVHISTNAKNVTLLSVVGEDCFVFVYICYIQNTTLKI